MRGAASECGKQGGREGRDLGGTSAEGAPGGGLQDAVEGGHCETEQVVSKASGVLLLLSCAAMSFRASGVLLSQVSRSVTGNACTKRG